MAWVVKPQFRALIGQICALRWGSHLLLQWRQPRCRDR